MRNRMLKVGLVGAACALLGASSLMAHDNDRGRDRDGRFTVRTTLVGDNEIPAVFSTARGQFSAVVDTNAQTITWRLRYEPLEADVTQAHVHVGQVFANGGISFFLCSNVAGPPPGTQACPPGPADISGVITPDQIIGPASQGVVALDFARVAERMREGTAYANVHSVRSPAGEIRGQLR